MIRRKVLLGLFALLINLGTLGTAASAETSLPDRQVFGKVTAAMDVMLTVETRRGTVQVYVDDQTVFKVRGVEEPSLTDIHVGDTIAGRVVKQQDGTLLARAIAVILPLRPRLRGLGQVTAVDPDMLTVEARRGTVQVYVDDQTVFKVRGVEEPSLEDVHVGDTIVGRVVKQQDGTWLARAIAVISPLRPRLRGLGQVTAVDPDMLTVETRRGIVQVYVDERTVFMVRGVEEPSLADVHVGDTIAGRVVKQQDGTWLARAIAVVPPKV